MQIALAESQRDAEDEERRRRNDDLKVKIALERSVNETSPDAANTQSFDFNTNSHPLDPSFFDTNHQHNDPYLSSTTAKPNIGWNPPNHRPSTHLGVITATNDPWSSETNGRSSAITTTATNDPWQIAPPSTTPQLNPWGENNSTNINNGAGLSLNINDPWGLGTNDSQTTKSKTTAATTNKAIDNELSEFFGASANIAPSYDHQPQASSNPWNIPSANFPVTSNNSNSHNDLNAGSNLLYPTLVGGNVSNSNNASPIPSAISTSRKTPDSFLGENFGNLVNLDKLVTERKSTNPFGLTAPRVQNPFANLTKPPTLDQLSSSNNVCFTSGSPLPPPLIPSSFNTNTSTIDTNNPFM
jgi:hypothetical protein